MAEQNWQQIKAIFTEALKQKPEERPQFLDRVCSDDKLLRSEVESLLASYNSAESFMETPAVGYVADEVIAQNHKFIKGQTLGHYEIIRQIGKGGMGEVYIANDLELQRQVALKILYKDLLRENRIKGRLLREARAVAKLDHPNICAIYEISENEDDSFIVMQYVEGETLAEILIKENLSAEKSLNLAIQIAEALEEAHNRQIIHRDIKPANIIVTNKGLAKVLDFGLAKIIEPETDQKITQKLSSSGAIMGTVPYMSPEQLRDKTLDTRTDIFSFGILFYEMLSGISPFQKDSHAETISAILNDQPDFSKIPSELRPIVQKCLLKDKNERYQTVKDLLKDLENIGILSTETCADSEVKISSDEAIKEKPPSPGYYFWKSSGSDDNFVQKRKTITDEQNTKSDKPKSNYLLVSSIGLFFLILIGVTTWLFWQFSQKSVSHDFDDLRSVRLVSWNTGASSPYSNFRVSHDGKMLAYSSTQNGKNEGIYIKQTADGEEFRVTKDDWENHTPIWSPDDQRLAFASFREGQTGIYSCPALGSQTTLFKIIGEGNVSLVHWSKDGNAIFYQTNGNLFRLDLTTQETAPIIVSESSKKNYFNISPDEKSVVFSDETDGQTDLWTMPVGGGAPVRLTDDKAQEIQPRWHSDGKQILYTVLRNNHYQINVIGADGGTPEQITRGESEFELIDVSSDGTKIFYLSWQDKSDIWGVKIETGEEFESAGDVEWESWAKVSPSGEFILYQSNNTAYPPMQMRESSIVVKPLSNNTPKISLKGYNPHWLPDSRRIAFLRDDETPNKFSLWTADVISGEEKQITNASIPSPIYAILPNNRGEIGEFDWSPDSRQIVYMSREAQIRNVLMTAPETLQTVNLTKNDNPKLSFSSPKFSPDGSFIAYLSTQKPSSKDENPLWKIWLVKGEIFKEIYATAASLRLLGWTANDEILLETNDTAIKSSPIDVELVKISTEGKVRRVANFENIYATSMTLSADGKTVAYISRQDDRDNIFTASTTNGSAKRITTNPNAKLYYGSPAWSPDGKTIFFDKQEETNTISVFENFR